MLDAAVSTNASREFLRASIPLESDRTSRINTGQVLPKIAIFIRDECDLANQQAIPFSHRLEAFNATLTIIAVGEEDKMDEAISVLEAELANDPDSTVFAMAASLLQTIIDDTEGQIDGAAREQGNGGSDDSDPGKKGLNTLPGLGEDFDQPDPPKRRGRPSSWRDSVRDDGPPTDAWKESLEEPASFGDPDAWKASAGAGYGDSGVTDDYLSDLTATEFDRQQRGDVHGFHLSLGERLRTARNYLAQMMRVGEMFETSFRVKLGLEPRE